METFSTLRYLLSYESGVKCKKNCPCIYQNLTRFAINFNFIFPLVIGGSLLEDLLEPHQVWEGSSEKILRNLYRTFGDKFSSAPVDYKWDTHTWASILMDH